MEKSSVFFALLGALIIVGCRPADAQVAPVTLKAAAPTEQHGSTGEDRKSASRYGQVLGHEWGGHSGDWAQYRFRTDAPLSSATLHLRYARQTEGAGHLRVTVDGAERGFLTLPTTGGWGDNENQFKVVSLSIGSLGAGEHRLRVTAEVPPVAFAAARVLHLQKAVSVLDLVGNRTDKNTVGHGVNVALYTGTPSRFFYSTYNLGNVFSVVDGATLRWFPDYVVLDPHGSVSSDALNANLDQITIDSVPLSATEAAAKAAVSEAVDEQRQVCVTKEDVVVSRVLLTNRTGKPVTHRIEIAGDCRGSVDYRGRPGGEKATRLDNDVLLLIDKNAFPSVLKNGLVMAVGTSAGRPLSSDTGTPGAYRLAYDIIVPANGTKEATFACAFARDEATAKANLGRVLREKDPVAQNRTDWKNFYENQIPQFSCSDTGLNEIYGFRWFLLKFTLSGGDLGFFKYPVDMEGRQEFQTYCCYSAPFMAFDLNWNLDPKVGFGQLANMEAVAYEDGRFPWYSTPQTNHVPLDHASRSGQSLLPWTAWKFYQIHGRKDLIASLYPTMRKNMDWWISDRDGDGNGLFSIDHQLETGMDDLNRRWSANAKPKRYEAIDATSYTILNLQAVANMARVLGNTKDADYYGAYAKKAANALQTILWDAQLQRYKDRNPDTGELSDYNSLTIFYPLFAGVATKDNLGIIPRYLTNPKEYWTKFPVPALSQTDPEFDPEHRYWAGLTWPATNSHVVEGFADTAKRLDRSQMPAAAELFHRVAALHLRPRADFYEHYNPLTGQPLSSFRDYMHSWWIDTILRHVAGMEVQNDGSLVIDALPMGLKFYELRGAPYRGQKIDVLWNTTGTTGLVVRCDGRVVHRAPAWKPGDAPVRIEAAALGIK